MKTDKEIWAEIRVWERLKKARAKDKAANERERRFQEMAKEDSPIASPVVAPKLRDALERAKGGVQ